MIRALSRLIHPHAGLAFALLQRATQAIAGFITLSLVVTHLTVEQQGFYYTFAALIGVQIFFELGLGFVIAQYVSHEFAHLSWDGRSLSGSQTSAGRLRQLLSLSLRWYAGAALVMCAMVTVAGAVFFNHSATAPAVVWFKPWIALVVFTSANLLLVPVFAFIEGSGRVADFYRFRFFQTFLSAMTVWLSLAAGGGVWAPAVGALTNLAVGLTWLIMSERSFLLAIRRAPCLANSMSWKNDLWPMQWRIALSWMSGYLLTQLFTPLMFHYQGPEAAGQVGATMAITTMVGLAATTWITVQLPSFGRLIAKRDWPRLDGLFGRALTYSAIMFVVSAILLSVTSLILPERVASRFLPPAEIMLLFGAGLLNHFVASFALYLRAHKKEPFLVLSLVGAMLMASVAIIASKSFGTFGLVVGIFLVQSTFGLPTAYAAWVVLKRRWHS